MRTTKFIAGALLASAFPLLYYAWVQRIKDTWIQNDILHKHTNIFFPDHGRFSKRDPRKEFAEALILEPPQIEQNNN